MRTLEALDLAGKKGLDLVEVSPNGRPPVCRIIDYGKYQYKKSKREHEARKKQHKFSMKEIKLRPKTGEHDYQFKVSHIDRFLSKLSKVKVTIMFRGRENTHPEIGRDILLRIIEHFGDKVVVEQKPRREGRFMTMVLTPGDHFKEIAEERKAEKEREENSAREAAGKLESSDEAVPSEVAATPDEAVTEDTEAPEVETLDDADVEDVEDVDVPEAKTTDEAATE